MKILQFPIKQKVEQDPNRMVFMSADRFRKLVKEINKAQRTTALLQVEIMIYRKAIFWGSLSFLFYYIFLV